MKFGDAERKIVALLQVSHSIKYLGKAYTIVLAGKPTTPEGEPKTDIYVKLKDEFGAFSEIKISFKKSNADFLENKMQAERAEQLFGKDWDNVIKDIAERLKDKFHNKPLVFFNKKGRTQKGSITLGWKFELLNKPAGELSEKLNLTDRQLIDVYSGTNLVEAKKHASVNGCKIKNSGIATHIIVGELNNDSQAQDVFDAIIPIEEYCSSPDQKIYGAFKALNYRTFDARYDGNRPLGVYVIWSNNKGKLSPDIQWGKPLLTKGTEIYKQLVVTLESLDAQTTDDLVQKISDKTITF